MKRATVGIACFYLAGAVPALGFRYFDGGAWRGSESTPVLRFSPFQHDLSTEYHQTVL